MKRALWYERTRTVRCPSRPRWQARALTFKLAGLEVQQLADETGETLRLESATRVRTKVFTPASQISMTDRQRQMLAAINGSQFNESPDLPNARVWTWDVCDIFGRSAGGIMSSLVKRGWAGVDNSPRDEDRTCWLTQKGLDALNG